MSEALQQVREDLGNEAVILNSRQIRKNNRYNPDGEAHVEVTAAYDAGPATPPGTTASPPPRSPAAYDAAAPARRPAPRPAAPPPPDPGPAAREPMPGLARAVEVARKYTEATGGAPPKTAPEDDPVVNLGPPPTTAAPGDLERLMAQVRQIGDAVGRLERRTPSLTHLPEGLSRLVDRLQGVGIGDELASRLVGEVLRAADEETLAQRQGAGQCLLKACRSLLPPRRDIRLGKGRKVVAFVGASGAGKTTAVAKIAAGFAARRRRPGGIVWITADRIRVGALEQARAFAKMADVQLEEAAEADEVAAVLERCDRARLVLVDMPGCGPHEHREWQRQRRLLEAAGADEIEVVLDGMTSADHMLDAVEATEGLPQRRLLFSKMDLVVRPGAALSVAARSGLPVSYLTQGPAVVGGIEAGDLLPLVAAVIGAEIPAKGGR